MYTNTCELRSGSVSAGDGNLGWSSYNKGPCSGDNDNNNNSGDDGGNNSSDGGDNTDGGDNNPENTYDNTNIDTDGFYLCQIPWLNCARKISKIQS